MDAGSPSAANEKRRAPERPTVGAAMRLAAPAAIASMATPLLGVVDVWALGQSANPLDIAAAALGAVIFSLIYWSLGFIRMSVAGLTAQADGADDEVEARAALARGLAIGGGLGFALFALQWPIGWLAMKALAIDSDASRATLQGARDYFSIRIWGAPFAIATYALFGWFTARGRTDFLMIASLTITFVNIALDAWFVVGLGWGAAGVAAGTLLAELAGFAISAAFIARMLAKGRGLRADWRREAILDPARLRRTLSVNVDIFIRTLLLAICFAWFTQRGGAFGDVVLAANQALLQLFLFTGLALDGTAIAAETLIGRANGDRDAARGRDHFLAAVRATTVPAVLCAGAFSLVYVAFGEAIVAGLTPPGPIREAGLAYLPWIAFSPLIVVAAFQLDGIFIGATRAREMRDSMIVCAVILIPSSILLAERLGNHGLWLAFMAYFALRAATLGVYAPRIMEAFRRPVAAASPERP
ncbi:MAG: MATE family efflux transporter [Parvularculaceae bacterium]